MKKNRLISLYKTFFILTGMIALLTVCNTTALFALTLERSRGTGKARTGKTSKIHTGG